MHETIIKITVVKTHRYTKVIIIKKSSTNLPPQGKSTPTIPQTDGPTTAVKPTVVANISTVEFAGILDLSHFYICAA